MQSIIMFSSTVLLVNLNIVLLWSPNLLFEFWHPVQVFNCFGRQFCLHFEAFQLGMTPVYMAFLRFMGDDNEAKKFSYSLEVGANRRKLIWQGIPRSIRDSHRKVRDSQDGLVIQRNLALYFSGGDRQELKLTVTGHIWKKEWDRKPWRIEVVLYSFKKFQVIGKQMKLSFFQSGLCFVFTCCIVICDRDSLIPLLIAALCWMFSVGNDDLYESTWLFKV